MRWLPPLLLLHGAQRVAEADLQAHAEVFAQRLAQWPDWPQIAELEATAGCAVPADARPSVGLDAAAADVAGAGAGAGAGVRMGTGASTGGVRA